MGDMETSKVVSAIRDIATSCGIDVESRLFASWLESLGSQWHDRNYLTDPVRVLCPEDTGITVPLNGQNFAWQKAIEPQVIDGEKRAEGIFDLILYSAFVPGRSESDSISKIAHDLLKHQVNENGFVWFIVERVNNQNRALSFRSFILACSGNVIELEQADRVIFICSKNFSAEFTYSSAITISECLSCLRNEDVLARSIHASLVTLVPRGAMGIDFSSAKPGECLHPPEETELHCYGYQPAETDLGHLLEAYFSENPTYLLYNDAFKQPISVQYLGGRGKASHVFSNGALFVHNYALPSKWGAKRSYGQVSDEWAECLRTVYVENSAEKKVWSLFAGTTLFHELSFADRNDVGLSSVTGLFLVVETEAEIDAVEIQEYLQSCGYHIQSILSKYLAQLAYLKALKQKKRADHGIQIGQNREKMHFAHTLNTPISALCKERPRLSENGKWALDYLTLWYRFVQNSLQKYGVPKKVEEAFEDENAFLRGVLYLTLYRLSQEGRNVECNDTYITAEQLVDLREIWLPGFEMNCGPVWEWIYDHMPENSAKLAVMLVKAVLLTEAVGSFHHILAWVFLLVPKYGNESVETVMKSCKKGLFQLDCVPGNDRIDLRISNNASEILEKRVSTMAQESGGKVGGNDVGLVFWKIKGCDYVIRLKPFKREPEAIDGEVIWNGGLTIEREAGNGVLPV